MEFIKQFIEFLRGNPILSLFLLLLGLLYGWFSGPIVLMFVFFGVIVIIIIYEILEKQAEVILGFFHTLKGAFVVIFFILLLISAVWSLIHLPEMIVEKGENASITRALEKKDEKYNASLRSLTVKEYLDAEDNARKTIAQIFGAALVFIGFFLAWQRNQIQYQGQLTERFTKAIEQLGTRHEQGGPAIEIRLGGIYALEKLAEDSLDYHVQIFEILTAYVRENAPWPPAAPASGAATSQETKPTMRKDIQAILTVIGRRRWARFEKLKLNLSSTDLRNAKLYKANLEHAWLEKTNLRGANLWEANLTDAVLYKADLTGAEFDGANLTGTCFGSSANPKFDAIGLTLDQIQSAKNHDKADRLPTYIEAQLNQNQQNSTPPTQA